MVQDILIPLIVTGLAEFGDKTQLSILLLSSRTKKHLHLLLGVVLAFLIVDGVAVFLKNILSNHFHNFRGNHTKRKRSKGQK